MARAGGENFPVASRLLPARQRAHLLALYGFARLVDELGDSLAGDRLAALDELAADLRRCYDAQARPHHQLLARLVPTIRECALPLEPFLALIEANRRDQLVKRYATFAQLRDYCRLSADPVGELVLHVFGAATPERLAYSARICTALQLIEHCQDVAEDHRAGRIYLPAEEMERFGVHERELTAAHAGPALRALIAFQARRAARLLDDGAPLVGTLRGRQRIAVAAFVAGGRAALAGIRRAGYDVLAGPPRPARTRLAAELVRLLAAAGPVAATGPVADGAIDTTVLERHR
jgi:squalene synthase HpnC